MRKRLLAYADGERPDQAWASARSDLDLHSPLTESLNTTKCRD